MANETLNARACQALHAALTAAGKPEMAKEWLPARRPTVDWMTIEPVYPRIGSDANVAHRALDDMRAMGWSWEVHSDGSLVACGLYGKCSASMWADTAPAAIAECICAALGQEEK